MINGYFPTARAETVIIMSNTGMRGKRILLPYHNRRYPKPLFRLSQTKGYACL